MKESRYKFDAVRLISLWLLPLLLMFFIVVFLLSSFDSFRDLSWADILWWSFFFMFSVGVFTFLFFNHLPLAMQTELIIGTKTFNIIQRDKSHSCDLSEIEEVIEYSSGRLPWSSIVKWVIIVDNKEFIISSLTISRWTLNDISWIRQKTRLRSCQFYSTAATIALAVMAAEAIRFRLINNQLQRLSKP